MAKNSKAASGFGGFVFSTNPDFQAQTADNESVEETLPAEKQVLRVWLERGKGGKESTVVKGFAGPDERLAELARLLKNKCAAGGAAKDGNIIVQGDHRDRVLKILADLGYRNVKKAGG